MPAFPWLYENGTDVAVLPRKLAVQRQLGVPYPAWSVVQIQADVAAQARAIADDLRTTGAYIAPDREIVALIAYLQKLGKSTPLRGE